MDPRSIYHFNTPSAVPANYMPQSLIPSTAFPMNQYPQNNFSPVILPSPFVPTGFLIPSETTIIPASHSHGQSIPASTTSTLDTQTTLGHTPQPITPNAKDNVFLKGLRNVTLQELHCMISGKYMRQILDELKVDERTLERELGQRNTSFAELSQTLLEHGEKIYGERYNKLRQTTMVIDDYPFEYVFRTINASTSLYKAATRLGIHDNTLRNFLKKLKIYDEIIKKTLDLRQILDRIPSLGNICLAKIAKIILWIPQIDVTCSILGVTPSQLNQLLASFNTTYTKLCSGPGKFFVDFKAFNLTNRLEQLEQKKPGQPPIPLTTGPDNKKSGLLPNTKISNKANSFFYYQNTKRHFDDLNPEDHEEPSSKKVKTTSSSNNEKNLIQLKSIESELDFTAEQLIILKKIINAPDAEPSLCLFQNDVMTDDKGEDNPDLKDLLEGHVEFSEKELKTLSELFPAPFNITLQKRS